MEIDRFLEDMRGDIMRIAQSHGAVRVRIFGSVVRGEARPDSDLDVIVDMEPGRDLLDIVAIKQDLEDLVGRHVDVVTEAALSPYIREQVLKEAVTL